MISSYRVPIPPVSSFVGAVDEDEFLSYIQDDDSNDRLEPAKKKRRAAQQLRCNIDFLRRVRLTKRQAMLSDQVREDLGLAARNTPAGYPWSMTASEEALVQFSARELDVINVAHLLTLKVFNGIIPQTLVIDVSQSVYRRPWRTSGRMMSPTCGSKSLFVRESQT